MEAAKKLQLKQISAPDLSRKQCEIGALLEASMTDLNPITDIGDEA
jgi:hypothetical protein